MRDKLWEIIGKPGDILKVLLLNRGIKTKIQENEFFSPAHPAKLSLKKLGISEIEVKKAKVRLNKALKNKDQIFIYGDYDADGICATAILWESLYNQKFNVMPYIPDRFLEGYGLNSQTLLKLKTDNPKLSLIITVDNGIVAHKALKTAKELGIDIIITDHHQKDKKKLNALAIIHTTKISGSAVSWVFAREIVKATSLDLVAIGTVADQLPLLGANRAFVKYGFEDLKTTKRKGLLELFLSAAIDKEKIGTYEIGFIIAPRINAMGRLKHGIEALRLLCTTNTQKAKELAQTLSKTNLERQKIVEEVLSHAKKTLDKNTTDRIIILSHESYHEGVIGLAAAQITEKFSRPSIILAKKGDIAKASARSIPGFNIIGAIRELEHLILEGGGHEMAAGFSISVDKIEEFSLQINQKAKEILTDNFLTKKLKIDMKINFPDITWELVEKLNAFEPTGSGNYTPLFATLNVQVVDMKPVGKEGKHLKLKLLHKDVELNAIAFGFGETKIKLKQKIDIAYTIEEDTWSANKKIQLKIRDLKIKAGK